MLHLNDHIESLHASYWETIRSPLSVSTPSPETITAGCPLHGRSQLLIINNVKLNKVSSPVCKPLLPLSQLPCKHDLFPPADFSCQRFCRTYFVYSLINIYKPETHNNTANCLLPVMIANRISLTCSERLKCRGSHLLVRCPQHTASTGEIKECSSHPFRELLPNKIKGCCICSSNFPFRSVILIQ